MVYRRCCGVLLTHSRTVCAEPLVSDFYFESESERGHEAPTHGLMDHPSTLELMRTCQRRSLYCGRTLALEDELGQYDNRDKDA